MKNLKFKSAAILALALNALPKAQAYQDRLAKGLDQGTSFVGGLFDSLSNLVLAVSGIVALVSLGYIFYGFVTGERDVSKKLIAWGGGAGFIFIALGIVKLLFFSK